MSFCSFTKDFSKNTTTNVSNNFITEYLTDASGEAVKVYLYGLYLCENSAEEIDLSAFSKALYMDEELVINLFLFWEEYGLVSVISRDPFTVKYLSLSRTGKPRKFKPEKYTEFNKSIQTLITDRMISTQEYSEYFSIMEDYSIKPEAMLMIVKYCVDLKGANIGYRYISTVCRDFCERQITTVDAIEQELSDYITRTSDIQAILTALSIKRKPDIEDLKLFNKWRQEMQFELDSIVFAAKKSKLKNVEKLDVFMSELYANKCFGKKEIENYLTLKNSIKETAIKIASELSVYCEVIQPYIDNYVSPWITKGYDEGTLIFIANYCFRKKRKSFEEMDETVNNLYSLGLVTLESIATYTKNIAKDDEFIKKILEYSLSQRKPTKWDRETLSHWREWGFTDEMILLAARYSEGKNNPISYVNVILSNWKSKGIFTPDKVEPITPPAKTNNTEFTAPTFGYERTYSKEDFDKFFTDLDDIDL